MENIKNDLKSMFTEHWKYLAVNAACKLELFDKISDGQNAIEKLCITNGWDNRTLMHLVNFLEQDGFLNYKTNHTISLTEKGELLKENNPNGLHYACLNWAEEHLNAWQQLIYSIETGGSAFEQMHEKPFFDYLNENPAKLNLYHKAMYEYARDDYHALPDILDFGVHTSIMDVGGGYGAAISMIQQKYTNTKCYLFDLESVVKEVDNNTIEKISGDFFCTIPDVAETLILSRVLHDWDDEKALLILGNCNQALPENGILYVIENCSDKIQTNLSLLSLNMTLMCQSVERSSKDYINLCGKSGFTFQSEKQLNQLQTILIFKK
jgi:C-methyltransferase